MANLWPRTVIALTLADIDPTPVSVLGLSEEGYYTFEIAYVEHRSFAEAEVVLEPTKAVLDGEGNPIRTWNEWPDKETARRVFAAYLEDLENNMDQWLDKSGNTP